MTRFFQRYGLVSAVLLGFLGGIAFAAGTKLGTVAQYQGSVVAIAAAHTAVCPTESGTEFLVTVNSAVAVTLPNNGTVGCVIGLTQGGTVKATFAAQAGGTLTSPHGFTGTFAKGSIITARVTANAGGAAAQWQFSGDGS